MGEKIKMSKFGVIGWVKDLNVECRGERGKNIQWLKFGRGGGEGEGGKEGEGGSWVDLMRKIRIFELWGMIFGG